MFSIQQLATTARDREIVLLAFLGPDGSGSIWHDKIIISYHVKAVRVNGRSCLVRQILEHTLRSTHVDLAPNAKPN